MDKNSTHINPDIETGLISNQVKKSHSNVGSSPVFHKTVFEIVIQNVFSLFNIACYIVIALLILFKGWEYLFFVLMVIPGIIIGLYSDIKARRRARKQQHNKQEIKVIRDGEETSILQSQLCVDDIVVLEPSNIINVDGVVVFGTVGVNEAIINGSSDNSQKGMGDHIYAGSTITSGYAKIQVTKVDKETSVEIVKQQTNKTKRPYTSIESRVALIGNISIIIVLIITLIYVLLTYFAKNYGENIGIFSLDLFSKLYAFVVPAGITTFISIALLMSTIRMDKNNININNASAITMLSKADIVCFDKTGTLTDASLRVKVIEPLGNMSQDQISQVLSNLLNATKDNNAVARAIKNCLKYEPTLTPTASLPFTSERKYSGASFGTKGTFILGAIENLNFDNKSGLLYRCEDYYSKGCSVLFLGRSLLPIEGSIFENPLEPIAMIVIDDSVKEELIETIKWLRTTNKEIVVISGDATRTVSELAKSIGIPKSDNYISLEDKTDDEVRRLAVKYNIFGRATPHQKQLVISSLRSTKKNIAMVGDGINDILAMKSADCSIAMGNGCDEAKAVAQTIINDSNLAKLKEIIEEGNSVSGTIQRITCLYLTKALFIMATMIMFLIGGIFDKSLVYPFTIRHMYIWEIASVVIPSIFFALSKSKEKVKSISLPKTLLPACIIPTMFAATFLLVYQLRKSGYLYLDISLVEYSGSLNVLSGTTIGQLQFTAMAVASFTLFSLVVLYRLCRPFDFMRRILFAVSFLATGGLLITEIMLSIFVKGENNIMETAFNLVTGYQWIFSSMVVVVASAIYLYVIIIIEFVTGRRKHENQN